MLLSRHMCFMVKSFMTMNITTIIRLHLFSAVVFLLGIKAASAGMLTEPAKQKVQNVAVLSSSLGGLSINNSVGDVIQLIISGFLSLLAMIFIILMLTAGYSWMTASGDEEKVTKAKKTIQRAIIGLVVIMAAYAITAFVFMRLPAA